LKKFGNKLLLRYLFFGGLTTSISFLLYSILILFLDYIKAYSISYFFGIFLSYIFNMKHVFYEKLTLVDATKYFFIYVGNYLICAFLLKFCVEKLQINEGWGPLFVIPISVFITFILIKTILAKKKHDNYNN